MPIKKADGRVMGRSGNAVTSTLRGAVVRALCLSKVLSDFHVTVVVSNIVYASCFSTVSELLISRVAFALFVRKLVLATRMPSPSSSWRASSVSLRFIASARHAAATKRSAESRLV